MEIMKINAMCETCLRTKASNLKAHAKCDDADWIDIVIHSFRNSTDHAS